MKNIVSAGKSLLFPFILLLCTTAGALDDAPPTGGAAVIGSPEGGEVLLLEGDKSLESADAIPAGTYILPEAPGQDSRGEKCMTVCARWGEDCLLISKGAGGMQRKCRRTCKQFAEECF